MKNWRKTLTAAFSGDEQPERTWSGSDCTTFGTIGGASGNARDFQFAGHYNF